MLLVLYLTPLFHFNPQNMLDPVVLVGLVGMQAVDRWIGV